MFKIKENFTIYLYQKGKNKINLITFKKMFLIDKEEL